MPLDIAAMRYVSPFRLVAISKREGGTEGGRDEGTEEREGGREGDREGGREEGGREEGTEGGRDEGRGRDWANKSVRNERVSKRVCRSRKPVRRILCTTCRSCITKDL